MMSKITLHGISRHILPEHSYNGYLICECRRDSTHIWYEAIESQPELESISRYGFDTIEDLKKYIDKISNKNHDQNRQRTN